MADTIITGRTGVMSIGVQNVEIYQVTLNLGEDALPANAYGAQYKRYVPGLKDFAGSFMAFLSTDVNPSSLNANGTASVQYDATHTVTANVRIFGVQIAGQADGLNIVTGTFAHADQIAPVWSWATGS